ncbi:MAG: preprotein translocase subunit SecG [Alphaproteobacteria bacterium]|nr:preprotein translocase subunit SecG [Alphaproteobacteria bacterium]
MLLSVLLGIHFVLTLAIIGLILVQKHDSDGALGSSGGGAASGMFSVRGQANILTKLTGTLMTIFVLNCLLMAKITKHAPAKESVIDKVARESVIPPATQDNSSNTEGVKTQQGDLSNGK